MEQSFAKGQPVTSNLQINKIPGKKHEKTSEQVWFPLAMVYHCVNKILWGECISSILFF